MRRGWAGGRACGLREEGRTHHLALALLALALFALALGRRRRRRRRRRHPGRRLWHRHVVVGVGQAGDAHVGLGQARRGKLVRRHHVHLRAAARGERAREGRQVRPRPEARAFRCVGCGAARTMLSRRPSPLGSRRRQRSAWRQSWKVEEPAKGARAEEEARSRVRERSGLERRRTES